MTQNKRKILHIVTQAEWGGAQKYVFDLATNLADEFDVTVATGANGSSQELLDKLTNAKIKNFTFKHLKRDINLWHDFLSILEIAKFLRQKSFDVVHLNSTKTGVIGALANTINRFFASCPCLTGRQVPAGMAFRMTKNNTTIIGASQWPKIIYTAHGWAFSEPLPFCKRWLYLIMEKMTARLRDHTIVLSEKEKQIALKNGTAKLNTISVIANGLGLDNLHFFSKEEARQKLNLDHSQTIIGTIANLYKTKGLEYLVESISKLNEIASRHAPLAASAFLRSQYRNLMIIGEGPERKNLESKIKKNKLEERVTLHGNLPQAYQYLPAFDIFVLPSIKEGFPYTILEAMAAGLPIVATEVGAISEILENQKTGLIVPSADSLALAEAIISLIKNPEFTRQLGINAKESVKRFDLRTMIEKTKKSVQGLLPEICL